LNRNHFNRFRIRCVCHAGSFEAAILLCLGFCFHIASRCSDYQSLYRQEADNTKQSKNENAASIAQALCHSRNLGPYPIAYAEADRFRSAGTREMAERLKFIGLALDLETNEFASDRRVEKIEYNQKLQPTLSGQFQ